MIKEILGSPVVQLIFAVITALAGITTIFSYCKARKHKSGNQQNGQLIAPVIHDKVTEYPSLSEDTVLTLSSSNKFFRIEN